MQVQYIITISGEPGKLRWQMEELLAGLPDNYTALESIATGKAQSAYGISSRVEDAIEIEVKERFPESDDNAVPVKVRATETPIIE